MKYIFSHNFFFYMNEYKFSNMFYSILFFLPYYFTLDSPSAPTSAHSSRIDLNNVGRPATGSVLYLGKMIDYDFRKEIIN